MECRCPPNQGEKGSLKNVLCVARVTEDALADPRNQRTMALQERLKSGLIAVLDEVLKQQVICLVAGRRSAKQFPDSSKKQIWLLRGHGRMFSRNGASTYNRRQRLACIQNFHKLVTRQHWFVDPCGKPAKEALGIDPPRANDGQMFAMAF
jgi:hypothetical protein